jgi:hypothetical protein
MSDMSEKARSAAKSKAERLVRADPKARVDASDYRPEGAMDADVITGERPVSRRQYRRGGKVAGEHSVPRADRKPRANGGGLTANSLINRDVKEANKERGGITHDGGMKRGGRAHKDMGGLALPNWADSVQRKSGGRTEHKDEAQDRKLIHEMGCDCGKCHGGRVGKKAGGSINDGTRPEGGRMARKSGGRAKKGTNVSIIISQPPQRPAMPMATPPGAPAGPVGMRQGAPPMAPPVGMAQGMPPQGAPGVPPAAPMMPRATGGRTGDGFGGMLAKPGKYPIESGAGGGLGRLEKAQRAARG